MTKVIIGINGPAGAGKTWLTSMLKTRLTNEPRIKRKGVEVLQVAPIIYLTAVNLGYIDESGVTYENYIPRYFEHKDKYGRTPIVEVSEAIRANNPDAFSEQLIETPSFRDNEIILIDNFGIPREQVFYLLHSDFCATLRINQKFDPSRVYDRDAPMYFNTDFPGDCRRHLPAYGGWDGVDSQEVFEITDAVLNHAAHSESPGYNADGLARCSAAGITLHTFNAWKHFLME
jgi:hypothetical protein